MEDELEDKIFYQTYVSYMKILSKFAVGIPPINATFAYVWRLLRLYLLKPEILLCGAILFVFLIYLQAFELWSRGLLSRISNTFGYVRRSKALISLPSVSPAERLSWESIDKTSAVYAVQGRRPRMEDRFIVDENINNNTGVSFFAVFDGHGGEFAAEFAKEVLVQNIYDKIIEATNIIKGKVTPKPSRSSHSMKSVVSKNDENKENIKLDSPAQRRASFKKSLSSADDSSVLKNPISEQDDFITKINSILRQMGDDNFSSKNDNDNNNSEPQVFDAKTYVTNGQINYGKLITDEVLAADYKLVKAARKQTNVAGTTALMAILHGTKLIVANIGDSRGVMCDSKGNAIPLSFDHKPQQVRERKRIHEAGGFIAFKGVWRVAGILATSRALGDYPLKEKKLVIADPDILTFDLADHKPMFLIFASDGLWDTFTNEEAVAFIKSRLHEPHYGAKSITLESYFRGSVDNISVIVIVFKDGKYYISSSS